MKYLIEIDRTYMTVELAAKESKGIEYTTPWGSVRHVTLTADRVLVEPTETHRGSGLVRMYFHESRNTTSEVCTIFKVNAGA